MVAIMPQHVNQNVTRTWLFAGLVTTGMAAAQAADIRLQVENVAQSVLHAELHSADATRWDAPLQRMSGSREALVFHDVPPGRYAVQLFVDVNANGRLDLTPRGLPTEPVGFSSNPRLFKGKPAPSGCAFEHGEAASLVSIELRQRGAAQRGAAQRAADETER